MPRLLETGSRLTPPVATHLLDARRRRLVYGLLFISLAIPGAARAQELAQPTPAAAEDGTAVEQTAVPDPLAPISLPSPADAPSAAAVPGDAPSSVLFIRPLIAPASPSLVSGTAPLWSVESSDGGSRGGFLLFSLGLVAGGAALYKIGEATDVGFVESTGAFMAGAGLLAIILPFWLFI